jgi:poly(A) polymerase
MYQGLYAKFDHHDKMTPIIVTRSDHPISRKMIDEEALKVLYRLHRHGFISYLVGGSVRDLLLGKVPKDFDVATNAHPHEIKTLFKNSRIIGRRFRLVQVFFKGGKVIEVSTFRSYSEFEEMKAEEGGITTDRFGTPEEDALRRDITINGLFYNISDFSIIDYVSGIADIKRSVIRTIGNPDDRFQQDPVRMIRVIRHAARTGFSIEEQTYEAILRHREEIRKCSPSRIRDEFLRDLKEGAAEVSLKLMLQTGLLFSLFPDLQRAFGNRNPSREREIGFLLALFRLAGQLNKIGILVQESILLALFLSPFIRVINTEHPFLEEWKRVGYLTQTIRWAFHQILNPFSFSKRTKEMAVQILIAQGNLKKSLRRGGLPRKLKIKRYFQEAVLFFGLEAQARGERVPRLLRHAVPPDLLPWWPKGFKRRR